MNLRPLLHTLLFVAAVLVAPATANAQRNASRVDFDDQLVQGQVNRGAVHLIERKDSDLGSLVKVRKNYRKEILAGTPVEAAEEPSTRLPAADISAPKGLPVVKPVETSDATPKAEAKAEPAKAAAAMKAVPAAKKTVKAPAKKVSAKSKATSKPNGGNRVVSRR